MSSSNISMIKACQHLQTPAIGLVLGANAALWLRWDGKDLHSHSATLTEEDSVKFFELRLFNEHGEVRWQRTTQGGISVYTQASADTNFKIINTNFLLVGTVSAIETNWITLRGGPREFHIPYVHADDCSKLKGRAMAIVAVERVARGPQGNAQIVATLWRAIAPAPDAVALAGQTREISHV